MLIKNAPRREYRIKGDGIGVMVPGVTTVLDVLAKPALHKWFWEGGYESAVRDNSLGMSLIPLTTFGKWQEQARDATAGVGTISHYKIQCFLTGKKEEYGPGWEEEHIKMAQVPFETFLRFFEDQQIKPILVEHSAVHEKDRYGGTFDLLADTKKGVRLYDFKTSKAIYDENYIQAAAYKLLLDQVPEFRDMGAREHVVLITKDGRLDAPLVSRAYMSKARATWKHLIKMYHHLTQFRKAA